MDEKSKVYILVDDLNRVLRCEGGYTMGNIDNTSEWIFIDEGEGDKFNLCQSHYFPDGLFTDDGIARYKFTDGAVVLRTYEEIEADRTAQPTPPVPAGNLEQRVEDLEADTQTLQEAMLIAFGGEI